MKKVTIVKVWIILLIFVIIYALTAGQTDYTNHPNTFGISSGAYEGFSLFLYVGGYLYLTILLWIISSIFGSSKIIDTKERNMRIIAKVCVLVFLLFPVLYVIFVGI